MNMFASFTKPFAFPICSVRADSEFGAKSNSLKPSSSSSLHFQPHPLASKIVVKNLPYSTGETTLQKEFSNFGKIAEVKVVKDVITKRSKGFAFIQYTSQDDAMLALETMDQKVFHGRTICVEIATLGRDDFGAHPKTSGPPKKWNLPQQEETVDCWY
ncbi:PREDICTED: glycine-rich RNA-binding protein 4, mitochondrial [Lupinus angustifolius]|uniref:glycine-rich RNA-binding protein 4, mitochondrial n=1 Tax=Lupinus angustifolius TaxID=3871 RepID=UPI00092F85E2|nr:PREDICTED: glycine-rich RNA-binding protein 4, mitochondrial [Lupinus angustifolius]